MKKSFLFLFMLMSVHTAWSQFIIEGTVIDKYSKKPISNATVFLNKTESGDVTDSLGKFRITQVAPENHLIEFRHIGYHLESMQVLISASLNLNIELEPEIISREPVEIIATRANEKSAMAFTNVSSEEIEKNNSGRDIPYLLESVPSLVATSDAGTGIGYTGVRVRGSDGTRINVTMDGIPINDAESQQLYWVDMPDLATSLENIQVQRGVGTSTNGAGAFGGSINMQSAKPSEKPFVTTSGAYGSFNTFKANAVIGTGLVDNKWNFEGRLSKITSDGYVDRASADLKSFYVSGGYYGKKDIIRMQVISGKEITYQSWYGVPEASLDTNRTWNYYTYDNQVDDYQQDHYRLFYTHFFSDKFQVNTAFHYTYGRGFYEEYEADQSLSDYQLDPVIVGDDTVTTTNLVRQKWLDNDFYGATFSLLYQPSEKISITGGGAWNQYDGDHYGVVTWAQYASNGNNDQHYYDNNGLKTDFNVYARVNYRIFEKLDLFVDLQYRGVDYEFTGIDEEGTPLPQSDHLDFFNPKAGLTYTINDNHYAYVSFSTGNKEPSRDDYTETTINSRPKAERLYDFEGGYNLKKEKFSAGFNYFMMLYENQLVLTGAVNDVGNYTRTNADKSSREGIELEGGWMPSHKFIMNGNVTFSRSEIKDFLEYYDDYDNGGQVLEIHRNTDIAFSPDVTAFLNTTWMPVHQLELSLTNRYIGEQYLDNTSSSNKTIDAYFVNDFRATWTINPKFMKAISFSAMVYNLFDEVYESNGYTYSYVYGGEKITENFYYPQAGTSFMGMVTLKF